MSQARPAVYSRTLILLHWTVALLIAIAFAAIELRVLFEKQSIGREGLKTVHFHIGLIVLALVLLRLAVRAREHAAAISPKPPLWQTWLSHLVHTMLYGFMLAMPILGWLTMSAAGKPIPFGLPALVVASKDAAGWYKELHHQLGQLFCILIGLHVAAAVLHHVVVKDDILKRMIPQRG